MWQQEGLAYGAGVWITGSEVYDSGNTALWWRARGPPLPPEATPRRREGCGSLARQEAEMWY